MHGEIRHIRNLNHKPKHINEIINILFPLHRIQQFAIWFCWSVFFLCSSSMFWSTSYNYHRTLNEVSSIWLVFTSTLECIELLESSNKPFIIERIHFHRKLFRSFFFTFFVDSYFGCFFRFLCRLKPPSSIHGIWNVVSDTEEFRWIRWIDGDDRDRKKQQQQPLISYLKCDAKHLFVHLMIWMTESSHFSDFHTIFDKFAARKIIITIPFCRVLFRLHP